ncbi:MAG: hypothetical protein GX616_01540, partial [Planctomycetes bacterium]|nr:hypothetical protein [Planctomycetota bacterium]
MARTIVRAGVLGLTVVMSASFAVAGSGENIRYYELYVPPNGDGANNPASSWGGVLQPMSIFGDGFGNDTYDLATMGMKHDGTARFVDSGDHGLDGFWIELPGDDAVDMEIRVHGDCAPSGSGGTGHTFEMLAGGADNGLCVAMDTDKIRLIDNTGTYGEAAIDLTAWKRIRFAMTNDHPTSGEDLPPVATSGEDTWVKVYTDEGSGWVSVIDWTQVKHKSELPLESDVRHAGSDASKFVIHCSGSATTNSDFSAKYFRVSGGGFLAYGGARGMKSPQENSVYTDECDMAVFPIGTYYRSVTPGVARVLGYLAANTSNTTGVSRNWTVTEADAAGTATDYTWISLDKAGGIIKSNETGNDPAADPPVSEYVVVTLNGDGMLPSGYHTAYLKFTDDCSPPNVAMRQINYEIDSCSPTVDPSTVTVFPDGGCTGATGTGEFAVNNTGTAGFDSFTFTVSELDRDGQAADVPWLSVSSPSGNPIAPGGSETVTVTVDFTKLEWGRNRAFVRVIASCDPTHEMDVAIDAPSLVKYEGNVDPTSSNSSGPGASWAPFNYAGTVDEGVEPYPDTLDNAVWKMTDGGGSKKQYKSSPTMNIAGGRGATILARVAVTFKVAPSGENIGIKHDGGCSAGYHWGGAGNETNQPGHVKELVTGQQLWIEGQTQEYYAGMHILRLAAGGDSCTVRLYLDENPTPIIETSTSSG